MKKKKTARPKFAATRNHLNVFLLCNYITVITTMENDLYPARHDGPARDVVTHELNCTVYLFREMILLILSRLLLFEFE